MDCPPGTFSTTRAPRCEPCQSGKYAALPGLASCVLCAAGSFASETGRANCTACSLGSSQGAGGQRRCDFCEPGRYVAFEESKYCFFCDDGYKSLAGSSSCDLCSKGYYWGVEEPSDVDDDGYAQAFSNQEYKWGCQKCPDNAACPEGQRAGDHFQPIPDAGYFCLLLCCI